MPENELIQNIIYRYVTFFDSRGWNQEQAAEEIGCSRSHLNRIVNGKRNPSVKLLMQMESVMERTK